MLERESRATLLLVFTRFSRFYKRGFGQKITGIHGQEGLMISYEISNFD